MNSVHCAYQRCKHMTSSKSVDETPDWFFYCAILKKKWFKVNDKK